MKISAARAVSLLALMVGTSLQVFATGIDYTCASNISTLGPSNTCAQLNSTIANLYNSSFSNANASIYIEYGNTGLGESTSGFLNLVSYSTYFNALTATASGNAIDVAALASLSSTEPSLYNGGDIELTSALAEALNITTAANGNAIEGTTDTGAVCTDPGSGSGINACYNGIITISRPANLPSGQTFYYRSGTQGSSAYDFFSVVEHETDEILGTSSCISTGGSLTDGCGGTNASAVDLFRYNGGSRAFISTTVGAYFSFNGGASNGADGAVYNTLANGNDYADFTSSCTYIQDGTGCLGKSFDITTDGTGGTPGPEINILDAVGYNQFVAPEPGTLGMLGLGLAALVTIARRRNRQRAGQ